MEDMVNGMESGYMYRKQLMSDWKEQIEKLRKHNSSDVRAKAEQLMNGMERRLDASQDSMDTSFLYSTLRKFDYEPTLLAIGTMLPAFQTQLQQLHAEALREHEEIEWL